MVRKSKSRSLVRFSLIRWIGAGRYYLPGPRELPNDIGPAKRRRPGKRNSIRHHKFEAEKRKRKGEEKKADMACLAGSGPEEAHEKLTEERGTGKEKPR